MAGSAIDRSIALTRSNWVPLYILRFIRFGLMKVTRHYVSSRNFRMRVDKIFILAQRKSSF